MKKTTFLILIAALFFSIQTSLFAKNNTLNPDQKQFDPYLVQLAKDTAESGRHYNVDQKTMTVNVNGTVIPLPYDNRIQKSNLAPMADYDKWYKWTSDQYYKGIGGQVTFPSTVTVGTSGGNTDVPYIYIGMDRAANDSIIEAGFHYINGNWVAFVNYIKNGVHQWWQSSTAYTAATADIKITITGTSTEIINEVPKTFTDVTFHINGVLQGTFKTDLNTLTQTALQKRVNTIVGYTSGASYSQMQWNEFYIYTGGTTWTLWQQSATITATRAYSPTLSKFNTSNLLNYYREYVGINP